MLTKEWKETMKAKISITASPALWLAEGVAANPSCHWVKVLLRRGQVSSLSEDHIKDKPPFALTPTPVESSQLASCPCLWIVRGCWRGQHANTMQWGDVADQLYYRIVLCHIYKHSKAWIPFFLFYFLETSGNFLGFFIQGKTDQ